jgi:hypothetical protein
MVRLSEETNKLITFRGSWYDDDCSEMKNSDSEIFHYLN